MAALSLTVLTKIIFFSHPSVCSVLLLTLNTNIRLVTLNTNISLVTLNTNIRLGYNYLRACFTSVTLQESNAVYIITAVKVTFSQPPSSDLCYTTFYCRITLASVCHCQSLPPYSSTCRQGRAYQSGPPGGGHLKCLAPSFASKSQTWVEVTNIGKHSSLL